VPRADTPRHALSSEPRARGAVLPASGDNHRKDLAMRLLPPRATSRGVVRGAALPAAVGAR